MSSATWGTLQLGRQYTIAHTLSTRFQPLTNPNQDSLSVFSAHHIARQDNMVKYSKNIGPFQWLASVNPSEGTGKSYSVGGGYAAAPFDVVLYGERMRTPNNADMRTVWGTGGNYTIVQGLKLWAGFSKQTRKPPPQVNKIGTGAVSWFVTPLLQLTAIYTQDQQTGIAAAGKRKLRVIAADYYLSKRTDVYAEIDQNTLNSTFPLPAFMATRDKQRGVDLGLRHQF